MIRNCTMEKEKECKHAWTKVLLLEEPIKVQCKKCGEITNLKWI